MMIYLKVISLFVCLWFTPVVVYKAYRGQGVGWDQSGVAAAGWTIFIYSMGWLV